MKVKDLIKELCQLDLELPVFIYSFESDNVQEFRFLTEGFKYPIRNDVTHRLCWGFLPGYDIDDVLEFPDCAELNIEDIPSKITKGVYLE